MELVKMNPESKDIVRDTSKVVDLRNGHSPTTTDNVKPETWVKPCDSESEESDISVKENTEADDIHKLVRKKRRGSRRKKSFNRGSRINEVSAEMDGNISAHMRLARRVKSAPTTGGGSSHRSTSPRRNNRTYIRKRIVHQKRNVASTRQPNVTQEKPGPNPPQVIKNFTRNNSDLIRNNSNLKKESTQSRSSSHSSSSVANQQVNRSNNNSTKDYSIPPLHEKEKLTINDRTKTETQRSSRLYSVVTNELVDISKNAPSTNQGMSTLNLSPQSQNFSNELRFSLRNLPQYSSNNRNGERTFSTSYRPAKGSNEDPELGSDTMSRKPTVNVATFSFGAGIGPSKATSANNSTDQLKNALSLRYTRSSAERYPICVSDVLSKNGAFDPVEYIVNGTVNGRKTNISSDRIGLHKAQSQEQNLNLAQPQDKDPPKPILKTVSSDSKLSQLTKKSVRFAFPYVDTG